MEKLFRSNTDTKHTVLNLVTTVLLKIATPEVSVFFECAGCRFEKSKYGIAVPISQPSRDRNATKEEVYQVACAQ